jgi:hypothetical protein
VRNLRVIAGALLILLVVAAPSIADAPKVEKSKNVNHLTQIEFTGGTELATIGDFVYAGEADADKDGHRSAEANDGGIHIIDASGSIPKEVGFLHCPGNDNDVEAVKPGLVVMGFHVNKCALGAGTGLMTVDVSNPRKPKILGSLNTGAAHTLKPLPGTSYVYMAGGDLSGGPGAGPAIVDVSNPRKPKVVATPRTLTTDCHDISFHISKDRKLGFCSGAIHTGEVQIFDVSDPVAPELIGKIHNPVIEYSHYAVASSDGTLLAIDDEAFAAHECYTGQTPTGRVWIYDISVPSVPILMGSFAAKHGDPGVGTYTGWVPSWCLSHGLDWMPKSHNLAVTWFNGGVSVLDLSNPVTPQEVAYFKADNSATYSALWVGGRLYTNDSARGVDAFEIKGLKK